MLIKVILVAAMGVIAVSLLRTSQGARHQAIRRLLLLAFAVLTVGSVLFPNVWNRAARAVGVGRGTDLLLYGLIVAFLGYLLTSYLRFRDLEGRLTLLARRLALDEAVKPPGPTSSLTEEAQLHVDDATAFDEDVIARRRPDLT